MVVAPLSSVGALLPSEYTRNTDASIELNTNKKARSMHHLHGLNVANMPLRARGTSSLKDWVRAGSFVP